MTINIFLAHFPLCKSYKSLQCYWASRAGQWRATKIASYCSELIF